LLEEGKKKKLSIIAKGKKKRGIEFEKEEEKKKLTCMSAQ